MEQTKLDRRRKYYMILDCETTTLAELLKLTKNEKIKKSISIGNPIIYDFAWRVVDRKGKVYRQYSFLVSEVWNNKSLMESAFYARKIPMYKKMLKNKEICLDTWENIIKIFQQDLSEISFTGAYNSMFDFKKAIAFTEKFIKAYNSSKYELWLKNRIKYIERTYLKGIKTEKNNLFNPEVFWFRGKQYPLFCLWGLSCKYLLNNDDYKILCHAKEWTTASKKYYPTTAEKTYAFISGDYSFTESHTALDDAIIETEIFKKIVKDKIANLEQGIIYFPFRILGTYANRQYEIMKQNFI